MSKDFKIVFSDGSDKGDYPVAVTRVHTYGPIGSDITSEELVVDPVYTHELYNNLYGRVITLVEATTDSHKLKAVKDLFGKELRSWNDDVFSSARDISVGINSTNNMYSVKSHLIQ